MQFAPGAFLHEFVVIVDVSDIVRRPASSSCRHIFMKLFGIGSALAEFVILYPFHESGFTAVVLEPY